MKIRLPNRKFPSLMIVFNASRVTGHTILHIGRWQSAGGKTLHGISLAVMHHPRTADAEVNCFVWTREKGAHLVRLPEGGVA